MASASHVVTAATTTEPQRSELDRLDRAVRALIEERAKLLHENESMREELDAMKGLQDRLVVEGQMRRDALRRIDELVTWIEELEPSLAGGASASPTASASSGTSGEPAAGDAPGPGDAK